jgi:hypothetical protein
MTFTLKSASNNGNLFTSAQKMGLIESALGVMDPSSKHRSGFAGDKDTQFKAEFASACKMHQLVNSDLITPNRAEQQWSDKAAKIRAELGFKDRHTKPSMSTWTKAEANVGGKGLPDTYGISPEDRKDFGRRIHGLSN